MKFSLVYQIVKALLVARRNQTLIAAAGVTFGITMFISLLGFMSGLNSLLDSLITNRTPHVRLYKELKSSIQQPISLSNNYKNDYHFIHSIKPKKDRLDIEKSAEIIELLKKDSAILGVSEKVSTQVFFNAGIVDLSGVLNGINVKEESELFSFGDFIVEGDKFDLENVPNSIIIGKGLAQNMQIELNDFVQIMTNKGNSVKMKVIGIYQSGLADIDKTQSFTTIQNTQKIMNVSSQYITDIQVKIKDVTIAPILAKKYRELFEIDAIDIQKANAQFDTGSSIRTLISYSVGITLLIVAGFGIYNILNMMIYEKMDTIAILKATGFSGRDVQLIFILVALSIGVLGGVMGLIFGFVFSSFINQIPFNNESFPSIKTYPVDFKFAFYIIAIIFSIVTTYFAGYFPSKKAKNIDPVDIIRGK